MVKKEISLSLKRKVFLQKQTQKWFSFQLCLFHQKTYVRSEVLELQVMEYIINFFYLQDQFHPHSLQPPDPFKPKKASQKYSTEHKMKLPPSFNLYWIGPWYWYLISSVVEKIQFPQQYFSKFIFTYKSKNNFNMKFEYFTVYFI